MCPISQRRHVVAHFLPNANPGNAGQAVSPPWWPAVWYSGSRQLPFCQMQTPHARNWRWGQARRAVGGRRDPIGREREADPCREPPPFAYGRIGRQKREQRAELAGAGPGSAARATPLPARRPRRGTGRAQRLGPRHCQLGGRGAERAGLSGAGSCRRGRRLRRPRPRTASCSAGPATGAWPRCP
jgi:hypothetical protein